MFGEIFKRELQNFTADEKLVNKFWKDSGSNYNKAGRYYHSLLHLDSLVDQLLPVKDQIEDWQTIILSVAYHDIIYNTFKQDKDSPAV